MNPRVAAFVTVFLIILLACYAGILARMNHDLSSFWPANAILAGIMVRYQPLNRLAGWSGAFMAFMAADLTTGGAFWTTVGLTCANMAGAITMALIAQRWPRRRHRLAEPRDVIAIGSVCAAGAAATSLVAIPISMIAFGSAPMGVARSWFSNELASYLAILPVVLTFPRLSTLVRRPKLSRAEHLRHFAPVLALPAAVVIGVWIGGPMALMIMLPLSLWSAVRGNVPQTAVLGLLATGWNMIALGSGITEVESFGTSNAVSVKLCLAFIAAAPLVVAAAVTSRDAALRQVDHLARHDTLTGLMNRRAYLDASARILREAYESGTSVTVFMLDLDHFKTINDRFGHPTGDALLAAAGAALTRSASPGAAIGRVGGEEFAITVAGLTNAEATAMGERIRHAISAAASRPQTRSDHAPHDDVEIAELLKSLDGWPVSVSVGMANTSATSSTTVSALITIADRQLYEAKHLGRDQLRSATAIEPY